MFAVRHELLQNPFLHLAPTAPTAEPLPIQESRTPSPLGPGASSGSAPSEIAQLLFGHYADEAISDHSAKGAHRLGFGTLKDELPIKTTVAPEIAKANDIVHVGLGKDLDELAAKSVTLEAHLKLLQKQGWAIKYGKHGGGTYTDLATHTIIIDGDDKGDPLMLAQDLAHESGHALHPTAAVSDKGLTEQQYIDKNVQACLHEEADATILNLIVREELLKEKAGDIGVGAKQAAKFEALYKKYPDPKDREKLCQEIMKLYGQGEHPSNDASQNYDEYYTEVYKQKWDKKHPHTP